MENVGFEMNFSNGLHYPGLFPIKIKMKKVNSLVTFLLLSLAFAYAKGPRDRDVDYPVMIGKRIFQSPLSEWLEKNAFESSRQEVQNEGLTLSAKSYDKGYELVFDINMVLNAMTLNRKGGKYQSYTSRLPFDLKWGMNKDSLYRVIDLRLNEVDGNPFILDRLWHQHKLQLIFTSEGLNQIKLFAIDSLPAANDIGFVRLLSYGKIVSGDCDSVRGKMVWDNGAAEYEGAWKNNLPHGKGYFKDKNNNWYKGEFRYGYFWGKGTLSVAGFFNYTGDFVMSRRQGTGVCTFTAKKGENYEGRWKEDAMNGLGKYTINAQNHYYGNMENNNFNGNGKLVTKEGYLEGNFKNGIPHGYMKQYLKLDNTMIEGQWVNGKREGKFTLKSLETKKITYKEFQGDIEIMEK